MELSSQHIQQPLNDFVERNALVQKNVESVSDKCTVIMSTLCQALGIHVQDQHSQDSDILAKILRSYSVNIPREVDNGAKISEIEDNTLLSNVLSQLPEVMSCLKEAKDEMKSMNSDFGKFRTSIDHWCNDMAQYIRLHNLLLHGLNNIPNLYGRAFSKWVARELNLLFPDLEEKVTHHDISRSHRLKTKNPRSNVVIVQFVNRDLRNMIYLKKKHLSDSNVGISEHLTSANFNFLQKAKKAGVFDSVWSFEARFYGFVNGERIPLLSEDDFLNRPKVARKRKPQSSRSSGYQAPYSEKQSSDGPSASLLPPNGRGRPTDAGSSWASPAAGSSHFSDGRAPPQHAPGYGSGTDGYPILPPQSKNGSPLLSGIPPGRDNGNNYRPDSYGRRGQYSNARYNKRRGRGGGRGRFNND